MTFERPIRRSFSHTGRGYPVAPARPDIEIGPIEARVLSSTRLVRPDSGKCARDYTAAPIRHEKAETRKPWPNAYDPPTKQPLVAGCLPTGHLQHGYQWADPAPRVFPASEPPGKVPHVFNNRHTGLTGASHDDKLSVKNSSALT
jgi:hypothetical protein